MIEKDKLICLLDSKLSREKSIQYKLFLRLFPIFKFILNSNDILSYFDISIVTIPTNHLYYNTYI